MTVRNTSAEVYYNEVLPQLGDKQKRVLDAFQVARRPICNQELAEYLREPINRITPRVKELREKGLVVYVRDEVYPDTNRKVAFWKKKDRTFH